jgi:hypothetical protein
MIKHLIPAVSLILTTAVSAQEPRRAEPVRCPYTSEEITIDGALTEAIWASAEAVRFMLPVTHGTPSGETVGRMCWDREFLFVAFSASDEDLQAVRTQRDSDTYHDDVLEAFFVPEGRPVDHHYFEINPLGTVADGVWGPMGSAWNCEGLRTGIALDGTLNDSTDRDRGWRLEMAIPLGELFPPEGVAPQDGDIWRFHLARYDHSAYLTHSPELSSCAPLTRVNFHYTPDWIEMRFEGGPSEHIEFPKINRRLALAVHGW